MRAAASHQRATSSSYFLRGHPLPAALPSLPTYLHTLVRLFAISIPRSRFRHRRRLHEAVKSQSKMIEGGGIGERQGGREPKTSPASPPPLPPVISQSRRSRSPPSVPVALPTCWKRAGSGRLSLCTAALRSCWRRRLYNWVENRRGES